MRILLDECVPARLKQAFPGHAVQTVTEAGWRTSEDESLLRFAEKRFDVFVTVDRKLEHEQDLTRFLLGFVIVRTRTNRLESLRPLFPQLLGAVQSVHLGQVIHVPSRD